MNIANDYKQELIKREKWQEYIKIKDVFTDELSLNEHTINTQKKLWEFIVEERNKMKDTVTETIRHITKMCYKVDEQSQIKTLNHPLFKFNHLYDQKFYNFINNDYEGLNKFLKILKSTFGNIELFIFKMRQIRSIISFIEEGRDKELIKEYNYLKNISLPISGYEDMRMNLITILKKYNQLKPVILDKKVYKQFKQEIKKFKNIYREEYRRQHLFYQNKIEYLKKKIITLPSYRVLKRLNKIESIKNKDIINYIDSFFSNKCNKDNINKILLQQPKCQCGFTIGENLTIPSLDKIKPMLTEAIIDYIKKIKRELRKYYQKNPGSDIKKIYKAAKIEKMEATELIKIIDEELIQEINYALTNKNAIKINISAIQGKYKYNDIDKVVNKFENILLSEVEKYTGNIDKNNVIIKIEV